MANPHNSDPILEKGFKMGICQMEQNLTAPEQHLKMLQDKAAKVISVLEGLPVYQANSVLEIVTDWLPLHSCVQLREEEILVPQTG